VAGLNGPVIGRPMARNCTSRADTGRSGVADTCECGCAWRRRQGVHFVPL